MSASSDMRDLRDYLDSALTGWIGGRYDMTTVNGSEAFRLAKQLRHDRHKRWAEMCVLRARLSRALADVDGLRATNEVLTNLVDTEP